MKLLILFLLSFPVFAGPNIEISQIRIHENTMVVSGKNLYKIQRATIGDKPIKVFPAGVDLVLYCKNVNKFPCFNQRWIPGNYNLKLFKNTQRVALSYPVVIIGKEFQERPIPPETIMPSPVGENVSPIPVIPPNPVGK